MNKHSAAKKRPARPSRRTVARKPTPRKVVARSARKPQQKSEARKAGLRKPGLRKSGIEIAAIDVSQVGIGEVSVGRATMSAVEVIGSALRAHKFSVGQTVYYTSSPISRPGATGSYKVVRLLPSDGDDYQYRIKHAGEAFERVAKESQLELEG
jgi:hypothetical protein